MARALRAGLLAAACCVAACATGPSHDAGATRTTAAGAATSSVAQRVAIPTAGISSAPAPLDGRLYVPATPGPHPAVVMLHGCGGAFDRRGAVNARHAMWGAYLAALGYEALLVDSFGARGLREICTTPMRARTLKEADRVGDAYAALAWLQSRPDVAADRIALLGWSHGGGVTLNAIARPRPAHPFRAAIAFYPGCTARNARVARFHPYAPLLVLIGEADDWTPAASCVALAHAVAAHGESMQIVTYAGTYHDFDNPALRVAHVRHEVPNGVHPGQGVTTAPNAAAREDAKRRVAGFLQAQLR